MADTEYDVQDVLEKYAATLSEPCRTIIRDVSELPYSKDVIKGVLRQCLALTNDERMCELLGTAYVSLANFQPLTEEQREALVRLSGTIDPETIASMGGHYVSVLSDSEKEMRELLQEFNSLRDAS